MLVWGQGPGMASGEQAIPEAAAGHPFNKGFDYSSFAVDEDQVEVNMVSGGAGTDKKKKKNPFTQYYAQLLHQQNMLQDSVRTGE